VLLGGTCHAVQHLWDADDVAHGERARAASTPPASGSAHLTSQRPDVTFPSEVAGLPVISVASADELLRSGKLDGQAVAVAGFYNSMALPCPYPGRYIGPLEGWCRYVAFTDTRSTAQLCQPEGSNGMSCSQPSGTNLAPFFMTETSGDLGSFLTGGATGEPAALVLIGHAGDARQWQCTAATQAQCASAFVVDRIAWANGHDVPPTAPQTGDQQTGKAITPRMTLAEVAAATGLGDNLLTGRRSGPGTSPPSTRAGTSPATTSCGWCDRSSRLPGRTPKGCAQRSYG